MDGRRDTGKGKVKARQLIRPTGPLESAVRGEGPACFPRPLLL